MSFTDVVAVVLMLALAALLVFTWYRCHVRLRAKGYGRLVISALLLLSLIAVFWLFSEIGNANFTVFGIPTIWILLAIGIARVLPTRAGGRAARWRHGGQDAGARSCRTRSGGSRRSSAVR